ncbi:MAG TPA: hypothetical protein VFB72_21150 [Verrucomicrobiae bacterium]|nr:hypothetical protein [Verrucomicrobiae bacterium]
MADKKDEKDVVTQLAEAQTTITSLTTERDTARTQLGTVTSERDTARTQLATVTTERDSARTELATRTTERDAARADVARITAERDRYIGENATLKAGQQDFDGRVRAELLKHGVRETAITLPQGDKNPDGSKMTLTEKVLSQKKAMNGGAGK